MATEIYIIYIYIYIHIHPPHGDRSRGQWAYIGINIMVFTIIDGIIDGINDGIIDGVRLPSYFNMIILTIILTI